MKSIFAALALAVLAGCTTTAPTTPKYDTT